MVYKWWFQQQWKELISSNLKRGESWDKVLNYGKETSFQVNKLKYFTFKFANKIC